MKSIGIRELRQQASRYVRDVEQGETIQVTDRGRPVAWLTPVPRSGSLAQLEASGRLIAAVSDLEDVGPPIKAAPGVELPSVVLKRLREGER